MSEKQLVDALAGRRMHLGELAQVFRHRHASWADFGSFLKWEFKDTSSNISEAGTAGLDPMLCRHNAGGRHHEVLTASVRNPDLADVFGHEQYSRPCVSHGAYEKGKNGGLVVHDLCVRAAYFLKSIGKGDLLESTGRDFEYGSPLEPASIDSSVGDPESQSAISISNITESRLRTVAERQGEPNEFDQDWPFEDEDVFQELITIEGEESSQGALAGTITTLSDFPSSQDSVVQLEKRGSSTKMRAATLGYLWGFADKPFELRREFRRLRRDSSLWVLHLCGCGLSFLDSNGHKVIGCCEHSHLMLGSSELNGQHRTFHTMLSLAPVNMYSQQVQIIRVSEGGDRVF